MKITEEPSMKGPGTTIWQIPTKPDYNKPAAISQWLVHAPWMYPFWQYHVVGLVHLRPIDGRDANFQFRGATHEFMVVALNPEYEPVLDSASFHILTPISIIQQFIATSDVAALEKVEILMQQVVIGNLSLDSDYHRHWKQALLGDHL